MSKITNRGVVLPSLKEPAASRPIRELPVPERVTVPLYHPQAGVCRAAVELGQTVRQGKLLGRPAGSEGAAPAAEELCVLSPVTGRLERIITLTHPLVGETPCAVLNTEGREEAALPGKPRNISSMAPDHILQAARRAGIVDELDGDMLIDKLERAVRLVRLAEMGEQSVCLVADATEQEPYASSAQAVLNEAAEDVAEGLRLAARSVGCAWYYIAVRLPYRERRELARRIPDTTKQVWGRYPVGLEDGKKPVISIGVQACLALWRAAAYGEKQSRTVLTVAGDAVGNPQNVRVWIGTPAAEALRLCGLVKEPAYMVFGDALTGTAASHDELPLIPGVSCLLAITERQVLRPQTCIGCGRCVKACHAGLLPFEIMRRLDNMQYERLPRLFPQDCDGCGACSYVCPSGLDVTEKVVQAARESHGSILLKWGDTDDL